jgi:hypothetical protein
MNDGVSGFGRIITNTKPTKDNIYKLEDEIVSAKGYSTCVIIGIYEL